MKQPKLTNKERKKREREYLRRTGAGVEMFEEEERERSCNGGEGYSY